MDPKHILEILNRKFTSLIVGKIFWFLSGKYITEPNDINKYYVLIYTDSIDLLDELPRRIIKRLQLLKVIVPHSNVTIKSYLFHNCYNLTNVDMRPPSGKLNKKPKIFIRSGAFYNCRSLTRINAIIDMYHIKEREFFGCSSLSNVNFFEDVEIKKATTVGFWFPPIGNDHEGGFEGCRNLDNVNISSNVISIGQYAFCDCVSLTNINIPRHTETIHQKAFTGCIRLFSANLSVDTKVRENAFPYWTKINRY